MRQPSYPVRLYQSYRAVTWICVTAAVIRLITVLPAFGVDSGGIRDTSLKKGTRAFLETRFNLEDASQYFHEAGLITRSGSLNKLNGFRTPGYPLLVAFFFTLFGENPAWVFVFQVILGTGTVFLTHHLAAQMMNSNVGNFAAGFVAFDPHLVFYGATLMTETLFIFLVLAGTVMLWKAIRNVRLAGFFAAGVLIGFATMVRPVMQFFPLIAIALGFLLAQTTWRIRIVSSLVFLAGFGLLVLPWTIRNASQFGHFRVSAAAGLNLLHQHAAQTIAVRDGRPLKEVRKDLTQEARKKGATRHDMDFENVEVFSDVAWEKIHENRLYYGFVHLRGIVNTFITPGTSSMARYLGMDPSTSPITSDPRRGDGRKEKTPAEIGLAAGIALFLLVSGLSAATGGYLMIKQGYLPQLIFVLLVVGYFCHVSGPISGPRFRIPAVPFLAAPAGLGLFSFIRYLKK